MSFILRSSWTTQLHSGVISAAPTAVPFATWGRGVSGGLWLLNGTGTKTAYGGTME
jgi:hypothetical protein